MPVRQPKVHDHQTEVISERVRYKVPLAREVLEPNLRLGGLVVAVDKSKSAIFYLAVNVERPDVLAAQRLTKTKRLPLFILVFFFFS